MYIKHQTKDILEDKSPENTTISAEKQKQYKNTINNNIKNIQTCQVTLKC